VAKNKIVYVLGAGFSAPLGIPVVRDFLTRAKDLYFGDREKYAHFSGVLEAIRALDSVKNYLHADLFDIEEVFSIIEMKRQLGSEEPDFARFIADVIIASTPSLPPPKPSAPWKLAPWGGVEIWRMYGSFGMALARIKLLGSPGAFPCELEHKDRRYDVISLNYDRALESPLDRLIQASQSLPPTLYYRPGGGRLEDVNTRTSIMKLHGDAVDGTVVPPTWDKSVKDNVREDWQRAYEILSLANHVRVLGYSFPQTDTYFRYFLKAALSRTEHLKTLDVLTLDPEGETKRRCESLFAFKFARFQSQRIEHYLSLAAEYEDLERTHNQIFA